MSARLRPGDWVQVKGPDEILETLDETGTIDHVPFMPEMLACCGRTFRVARRMVKSCSSGMRSSMRGFRRDDVVLLESVRCSGADHDGCQKACMIFWREAWLRKVAGPAETLSVRPEHRQRLAARLQTKVSPAVYFCQASELLKATYPLTKWDRIRKSLVDIGAGNIDLLRMARNVAIWTFWRIRRRLLGEYARGQRQTSTPTDALGLCAGDLVEIKPMPLIRESLDDRAYNRGLYFSPDMRLLCGTRQHVERRLEKIIVDGSGEMRRLRNTVYLEGSMCGCAHVAFGGCSRGEFTYWREIWLKRPAN
jgi:hypothetical protein